MEGRLLERDLLVSELLLKMVEGSSLGLLELKLLLGVGGGRVDIWRLRGLLRLLIGRLEVGGGGEGRIEVEGWRRSRRVEVPLLHLFFDRS